MRGRRRGHRARGFTLVEVLLAIALIIVIVSMAGILLITVADARDELERYTLKQAATDALIAQVEADLVAAVAGDGSGAAGVEGTAQTLKVLTRGRWLGGAGAGASDLTRTEASFGGDRVKLTRRALALGTLAPVGEGLSGEVEGVRRAEFWYYDGKAWRREFNSAKDGGLPAAVEVRLWFGAPPSEGEERVSSAVDGDARVDTPPDRRVVIAIPDGGTSESAGGGGGGR